MLMNSQDRAQLQYSSHGVREQTAELASWALADNSSLQSTSPNSRRPFTADSPSRASTYFSVPEHALNKQRNRDSIDSNLPEVQEVSEPVSPAARSSSPPRKPSTGADEDDDNGLLSSSSALTNMIRKSRSNLALDRMESEQKSREEEEPREIHNPEFAIEDVDGPADERTPLISRPSQNAGDSLKKAQSNDVEGQVTVLRKSTQFSRLLSEAQEKATGAWQIAKNPKGWDRKVIFQKAIKEPIGLLPCVFLGVLLNVLDALSYGTLDSPQIVLELFVDTPRHDSFSPR